MHEDVHCFDKNSEGQSTADIEGISLQQHYSNPIGAEISSLIDVEKKNMLLFGSEIQDEGILSYK